jgi:hypothetical protein
MMTSVDPTNGVIDMRATRTHAVAAARDEPIYPASLGTFQTATFFPVARAIVGVRVVEGPKPDGAMFYWARLRLLRSLRKRHRICLRVVALILCGGVRPMRGYSQAVRSIYAVGSLFRLSSVG